MTEYLHVSVYKYNYKFDHFTKGTLIEENGYIDTSKDAIIQMLHEKYGEDLLLKKPNRCDGIYAVIQKSSAYNYYRNTVVHSFCITCKKEIRGKLSDVEPIDISIADKPKTFIDYEHYKENIYNPHFIAIACTKSCKNAYINKCSIYEKKNHEKRSDLTTQDTNRLVGGFIYEIYNRTTDMYYVGKTIHSPTFRWNEHIMGGKLGTIDELSFRVITVVANRDELGSVEAWWIHQYKDEGKKMMNSVQPKFDELTELKDLYIRNVQSLATDKSKNSDGKMLEKETRITPQKKTAKAATSSKNSTPAVSFSITSRKKPKIKRTK